VFSRRCVNADNATARQQLTRIAGELTVARRGVDIVAIGARQCIAVCKLIRSNVAQVLRAGVYDTSIKVYLVSIDTILFVITVG
jgi:hypothetical protein